MVKVARCVPADRALPFSALRDLRSRGVSVDRPGDREAGLRSPGQPLRLHQEGGQLLLLVPRRLIAQEGVPGRRGALVAGRARLPAAQQESTQAWDDVRHFFDNIIE